MNCNTFVYTVIMDKHLLYMNIVSIEELGLEPGGQPPATQRRQSGQLSTAQQRPQVPGNPAIVRTSWYEPVFAGPKSSSDYFSINIEMTQKKVQIYYKSGKVIPFVLVTNLFSFFIDDGQTDKSFNPQGFTGLHTDSIGQQQTAQSAGK